MLEIPFIALYMTNQNTRDKKVGKPPAKLNRVDHGYQQAWQRFQRVSTQLSGLWKTKKNSLQILKTERSR